MSIVVELDEEVIGYMVKNERFALLDIVKRSWLSAAVMQLVFDAVRPETGLLQHVAKLATSHPNPEVRAMAALELCAFVSPDQLGQYLWC